MKTLVTVSYTVPASPEAVSINKKATKPTDTAVTIHGKITKTDEKGKSKIQIGTSKGFTVEVLKRGGFALTEKDGTVTVTAMEKESGRNSAAGVPTSEANEFLATLTK